MGTLKGTFAILLLLSPHSSFAGGFVSTFLKSCRSAISGANSVFSSSPVIEVIETPEVLSAKNRLMIVHQSELQSLESIYSQHSVNPNKFENLQPISGIGGGFYELYSANMGTPPEKVFIKVINTRVDIRGETIGSGTRDAEDVVNEFKWSKFLESMEWGPKVHGVTWDNNGRPAIAYEFIEGVHCSGKKTPEIAKLSSNAKSIAIAELQRMKEMFTKLRVNVFDLQVRIGEDGRVSIIDPEFFSIWQNPYKFSFEEAEAKGLITFAPTKDPRLEFEEIIQSLK